MDRRWNENYISNYMAGVITCLSVVIIAVIIVASVRGKCCFQRRTLFATPIGAPVPTTGVVPVQQPSAPPAYSPN